MRTLSVICVCLLAGGVAWLDVSAQEPAGAIFFQHRQFKIPFKNDQKSLGVTQVRLYVSNDQGRSWQFTATAAPEEQHFRFSTPQDGNFWFAVQTVDAQGKSHPPATTDLKANLRVIVDSTPPSVQVQALPARGNVEVGVAWKVTDDGISDLSLPDAWAWNIASPGAAAWIPLAVPGSAPASSTGTRTPTPQIEVRVSARDRAGNAWRREKTTLRGQGPAAAAANARPSSVNPVQQLNDLKDLERKFVNSKQISLTYDLMRRRPLRSLRHRALVHPLPGPSLEQAVPNIRST